MASEKDKLRTAMMTAYIEGGPDAAIEIYEAAEESLREDQAFKDLLTNMEIIKKEGALPLSLPFHPNPGGESTPADPGDSRGPQTPRTETEPSRLLGSGWSEEKRWFPFWKFMAEGGRWEWLALVLGVVIGAALLKKG